MTRSDHYELHRERQTDPAVSRSMLTVVVCACGWRSEAQSRAGAEQAMKVHRRNAK